VVLVLTKKRIASFHVQQIPLPAFTLSTPACTRRLSTSSPGWHFHALGAIAPVVGAEAYSRRRATLRIAVFFESSDATDSGGHFMATPVSNGFYHTHDMYFLELSVMQIANIDEFNEKVAVVYRNSLEIVFYVQVFSAC
jgi:hypothetical protein